MPADPIAIVDDLERRVGQVDPDDLDNAESLLAYASSLVRAYGNRAWDVPEEVPSELVEVVVGMVERAVTNPQGATQETAGPFTVSFGSAAAQRVYLTKGDRTIIRSAAGNGAFTIPQAEGQPQGVLGGVQYPW